jgi:hypothetical protein
MTEYRWRPGLPAPKIPATIFGSELERLAGGRPLQFVRTREIVDAARPRSSPIHDLFPWSDRDAAEKFRRQLARQYTGALQIIRVDVRGGRMESSKAFVNVEIAEKRGYVSQQTIKGDRDLTLQALERARKELQIYMLKFGEMCGSFGQFIPRLQAILEDMQDEIDRLTTDASARRPRPTGAIAETVAETIAP